MYWTENNSKRSPIVSKDNYLSISISRKNEEVRFITDALHELFSKNHISGVSSGSDLLCKWIKEGFKRDILSQIQKKVKAPGGTEALTAEKDLQIHMEQPELKRLLANKFSFSPPVPRMDKYHNVKIWGKPISKAFREGLLTVEEVSNLYLSISEAYFDMCRDTCIASALHLIKSKNDTKKKVKAQRFRDRVLDSLYVGDGPPIVIRHVSSVNSRDINLDDYEEIVNDAIITNPVQ